VVDDNRDAAEMLATLVELRGNDVRTAHDGHEALQTAREWWPNVVFLDIGLPGRDGYQVAKDLRSEQRGRSPISLVALTGYGKSADRQRSFEAGFDRHIVKPMTLQTLREVLNSSDDKGS
jgi:CheY-like chemotaxis protein